jgi:hypothetical protein
VPVVRVAEQLNRSRRAAGEPSEDEYRLGLFDGQGDRVVAPGSTGAGCWFRTTMASPAGRRYSAARCVAARVGVGGPSSSHRHVCPDGRAGGGGVRSATLRTIKRRSTPGARCARFRPRLRASARARTARSRVVRCGRLFLGPRRARSQGESSSPSLPAPRNPQCPVGWEGAVTAALLLCHRCRSEKGVDDPWRLAGAWPVLSPVRCWAAGARRVERVGIRRRARRLGRGRGGRAWRGSG